MPQMWMHTHEFLHMDVVLGLGLYAGLISCVFFLNMASLLVLGLVCCVSVLFVYFG